MSASPADDLFQLLGGLVSIICSNKGIHIKETDESTTSQVDKKSEADVSQNTLFITSFIKDKAIELQIRRGIEIIRKKLRDQEPLTVTSIDRENIKYGDVDVSIQAINMKLYNLHTFQVSKFKSKSEENAAEFVIHIPTLKCSSDFDIYGTFGNKKVTGIGNAVLIVTGLTIDKGRVVIRNTDKEVQIESLTMEYNFENLQVEQSGLSIEGFQAYDINKFLNDAGKKYFKDNRVKISKEISEKVTNKINAQLRGKTLEQLMQKFKNT